MAIHISILRQGFIMQSSLAGQELYRDSPAYVSSVLGLKLYTTMLAKLLVIFVDNLFNNFRFVTPFATLNMKKLAFMKSNNKYNY